MRRSRRVVSCLCTGLLAGLFLTQDAPGQSPPSCSITSIPRWRVEPHRWSNGIAGLLASVDFERMKTGGGTSMTVRPKPNGVEFSFVSSGSKGISRTFSHDMTAQMRDGQCVMTGVGTMFPGNATANITMVPQ